jgi:hypothetical protein
VEPLADAEMLALLTQGYGLTQPAALALSRRCAGRPGEARRRLADLARTGSLRPTPQGLSLSEGDLVDASWTSRMHAILEALPPDEVAALVVAAALGVHVDQGEWERAMGAPQAAMEPLVRAAVVDRTATGWRFAATEAREVLLARADDAVHLRCAAVLEGERSREHRVLAGEIGAIDDLILDAWRQMDVPDWRRALHLGMVAAEALERADVDEHEAPWPAVCDVVLCVHGRRGDLPQARLWAERMAQGDAATGLAYLANFTFRGGDSAAARAMLLVAQPQESLRARGMRMGFLGNVARDEGDIEQARICYLASAAAFEGAGEAIQQGSALYGVVTAYRELGDDEAAREVGLRALELVAGQRPLIEWYLAVELAGIDLGKERFDDARERLRGVLPELDRQMLVSRFRVGLALSIQAAAGQGDTAGVRAGLERLAELTALRPRLRPASRVALQAAASMLPGVAPQIAALLGRSDS